MEELLVSHKRPQIDHNLFSRLIIDNYLPSPLYKKLFDTFPRWNDFPDRTESENKNFASLEKHSAFFEALFNKEPGWKILVDFLKSDGFMADLKKVVSSSLLRSRGLKGLKKWTRTAPSPLQALFSQEIELNINLTAIGPQGKLTPHSDANRKLVSMILYFAPETWPPNLGGSTRFFKSKTSEGQNRWCNSGINKVKPDELQAFYEHFDILQEAKFQPNRFVLFVKNKNSFHDVSEILCPPDESRNAMIININAKK